MEKTGPFYQREHIILMRDLKFRGKNSPWLILDNLFLLGEILITIFRGKHAYTIKLTIA